MSESREAAHPVWPRPGTMLRWLLAPTLAGPVLGFVWWLAAPGGRLYGDGSDYAAWLARDFAFAGLAALAAVCVVVFVVRAHDRFGFAGRSLAALVGSGAGSLLMWLTGAGLARVWGSLRSDPSVDGSAFGLQALSALALWPAIVAVVVLGLASILWSPPTRP
ncbi:hypothetical protein SPF06_19425 [Sinomonas sp. JGH33]|uniref:Uncharacterized protein n=1 Tax=Sinomonas terricola TaxID=3110330 RepID=A0ABU5TBN7_9MICC|nr:hypothetical protein [Sinomonas sp. JGH33]MEA5456899.1 hypothetical protein [Sinomonas sp. JGH33]